MDRGRQAAGRAQMDREDSRRLGAAGSVSVQWKAVEGHADLPVRELVVAPYRIIYLPEPRKVSIITIKHSRQELTDDDLVLSSGEEDQEW
jgi:hypothetical protein